VAWLQVPPVMQPKERQSGAQKPTVMLPVASAHTYPGRHEDWPAPGALHDCVQNAVLAPSPTQVPPAGQAPGHGANNPHDIPEPHRLVQYPPGQAMMHCPLPDGAHCWATLHAEPVGRLLVPPSKSGG
jgi:hypothetical protein